MKLYLDDLRKCPIGWTLARDVAGARLAVLACLGRNDVWTDASLDHDLADEHYAGMGYMGEGKEQTGLAFVDWMIETNTWPVNKPGVHSMNPAGAARMRAAIDRYGPYNQER